ncbi:MAG TPA: amidohydrolase family protein, partial [Giesbergeria sp.]|nr:amidohydrolase family protein [Giesbergeria sp.]
GMGALLNAGQSITVQQALRAMTVNAAWQLRMEKETGSLEVGKWADLQIVDRNPYDTPIPQLDQIRTQAVYVGGKLQYAAQATSQR